MRRTAVVPTCHCVPKQEQTEEVGTHESDMKDVRSRRPDLVDIGASVDILYWNPFTDLGLSQSDLMPNIYGRVQSICQAEVLVAGTITVTLTVGHRAPTTTVNVKFVVLPSPFSVEIKWKRSNQHPTFSSTRLFPTNLISSPEFLRDSSTDFETSIYFNRSSSWPVLWVFPW